METTQETVSPEILAFASDPRMQKLMAQRTTRYIYSPFCDCKVWNYPGGFVPKGRIVAISAIVKENNHPSQHELDETQRLEEIQPLEIVESIVGRYAPRGAVEIKALTGLPEATFKELGLNALFFGPETDEQGQPRVLSVVDIRAGVDAALGRVQNTPPAVKSRIQRVANEILKAAQVAERNRRAHLATTHANMDKARNNNPNFNGDYDTGDLRAFQFLGIEPETSEWRVKDEVQPPAQSQQPQGVDWEAFGRGLAQGLGEAVASKVVEKIQPAKAKTRKKTEEAQAA